MRRFSVLLAVAAGIVFLADTRGFAGDDTMRLNGGTAPTMTLQGATAETVNVFHGRLLGCCRRPVVVYSAAPAYCGCVGGFGGYVAAPVWGYPAMGFAATAPVPVAVPAPVPMTAPPPRAVVAVPRLGLSISLGSEIDALTSRPSPFYFRPGPQVMTPEPALSAPVNPPLPETFRYDGGPANPVPLPGNLRPLPSTRPAPAANNQVKLAPAASNWPAYGEQPPAPSAPPANSLLVRTRDR